jgi:hypothetical protein
VPKRKSKEEREEAKKEARRTYKNKYDYKRRTCLRCPKTFLSKGPGNRICPKCADKFIEGSVKEFKVVNGKKFYIE